MLTPGFPLLDLVMLTNIDLRGEASIPAVEAKRIADEKQTEMFKKIRGTILKTNYHDSWVPEEEQIKSPERSLGLPDSVQAPTLDLKKIAKEHFIKKLIESTFFILKEILKQKGLEAAFDNELMITAAIRSVLKPLEEDKNKVKEKDERKEEKKEELLPASVSKEQDKKSVVAGSLEWIVGRLDQFILEKITPREDKNPEATKIPPDRIFINYNSTAGDYVYFLDELKPQPKEAKDGKDTKASGPAPSIADKKFIFLANLGLLSDKERDIISIKLIKLFGKRVFDILHDKARTNDAEDMQSLRKQFSLALDIAHEDFDDPKRKDMQANWFAVQLIRALQPIDLLLNTSIAEFNDPMTNFKNFLNKVDFDLLALRTQEETLENETTDTEYKEIHKNNIQAITDQSIRVQELREALKTIHDKAQYFRNQAIQKWQRAAYTALFQNYRDNQDIIGLKSQTLALPVHNVSSTFVLTNAEYSLQEYTYPEERRYTREHLWMTTGGNVQLDSRICDDGTQRKELLHGICFAEKLLENNGDNGQSLDAPYNMTKNTVKQARKLYRQKQTDTKHASLKAKEAERSWWSRNWEQFKLFWSGHDEYGLKTESIERRHLYDNAMTRGIGRAFTRQPKSIYRVNDIKDFDVETVEGNALVFVSTTEIYYIQNRHSIKLLDIYGDLKLSEDELKTLVPGERYFVKQTQQNQGVINRINQFNERFDWSLSAAPIRDALQAFALTEPEKEQVAGSIYRANSSEELQAFAKQPYLKDGPVIIYCGPEKKPQVKIFIIRNDTFVEVSDIIKLSDDELNQLPANERFFVKKNKTNLALINRIKQFAQDAEAAEQSKTNSSGASDEKSKISLNPNLVAAATEFSKLPDFSQITRPSPIKIVKSDDAFTATLEFVNQFFLFFDRDIMAQHPYLGMAFFTVPYINIAFPILAAAMSGGSGVVGTAFAQFGTALNTINNTLLTMEAGAAKYTGLNLILQQMHIPTATVPHLKAATSTVTGALTWATLAKEPLEKALVGCVMAKMLFNTAELILNNPILAGHDASLLEQYLTDILPPGVLGSLEGSTKLESGMAFAGALVSGGLKLLVSAVSVGFIEQFLPAIAPLLNELADVPWKEILHPKFTGIELIQTLAVAKSASFIIIKVLGICNNIQKGELFDVDGKELRKNSPSFDVLAQFLSIVHSEQERAFFKEKMRDHPQQFEILKRQFEELLARNPALWEEYRGQDGQYTVLRELGITRLESKSRWKMPLAILKGAGGLAKFLFGFPVGLLLTGVVLSFCYLTDRQPPKHPVMNFLLESAELAMKVFKITWTLVKTVLHSFLAVAVRAPEILAAVIFGVPLLVIKSLDLTVRLGTALIKGAYNFLKWFAVDIEVEDKPADFYADWKEPFIKFDALTKLLLNAHVKVALFLRPIRHWVEDGLSKCLTACRDFFIRPLDRELQVQAATRKEDRSPVITSSGSFSNTHSSLSTTLKQSTTEMSNEVVSLSSAPSQSSTKDHGGSRNILFAAPEAELHEQHVAMVTKDDAGPTQRVMKTMTVQGG